jgi:exopolyphosphatase / guanosine-5'-triphosphate,3'-diphosphate pyrophosphatase
MHDTEHLAAIDLGTNSFHLLVARMSDDGFEVVTRQKEMVRLGHGGGEMERISPEALERGISALTRMKMLADRHGAPVRAVATSAVREAENASEFIARAFDEAGVVVEVVSGVEEARLIHLGVLQALPVFERRALVVDVGGGSTEVLVGERGTELAARSFKLGAVRLTDRFFPGKALHPAAVSACRNHVRSALTVLKREVDSLGHELAIASSGTAETVARLALLGRGGTLPRSLNASRWTADEHRAVVARLVRARTIDERQRVEGLDPARADIILAGALILEGVVDVFGITEFTFSDYALREGVLLDTVQRHANLADGSPDHHLRDVARRSVRRLADRCDDDPAHSAHVATIAAKLFDATADVHGLGVEHRDLLEAAALLANVGLVISHSRHHLHSYYVIRNSELVGFTDREIELVALVARYHRKSSPKPGHPEYARLAPDDRRVVRVLAGILRVAIGLDRSHDGRVTGISVHTGRHRIVIEPTSDHGNDLGLERYAATERCELLAAELDRRIEIG